MSVTEDAEALLALCGELTLDDELIEATRKVHRLAAETDDVDRRFRAAMEEVKLLLLERMARS